MPGYPPLMRLLTLFLLLPAVSALASPPLTVYSMLYPPLHMGPGHDSQPGIGDDMVRAAAALAGLPVDIRTVPWARAQLMTQQRRGVCLFPLTRLPAREAQYQWVAQIASGKLQLYGWRDGHRLPDLNAAASYRISVLAGSSAELRLQQHKLPYSSTNLVTDGLRLLLLGQVDYWAVHDVVARYEARRANVRLIPAAALGEANSWLACHRDFPAAQRQALQQGFARLQASGEAEQISQRYLGEASAEAANH